MIRSSRIPLHRTIPQWRLASCFSGALEPAATLSSPTLPQWPTTEPSPRHHFSSSAESNRAAPEPARPATSVSATAASSTVSDPAVYFPSELQPSISIAARDAELFERLLPSVFADDAPDPELLQALALTCHSREQYKRVIAAFREARARSKRGFSIAVFEAQILLTLSGRFSSADDGDGIQGALDVFTAVTRNRGDVISPAIEGCKGLLLRQCSTLAHAGAVLRAADEAAAGTGAKADRAREKERQRRKAEGAPSSSADDEASALVDYLLDPTRLQPALEDLLLSAGRADLAAALADAAAGKYGGWWGESGGVGPQLLSWLGRSVMEPAAAAHVHYLKEPAPWDRGLVGRFFTLFEAQGTADSVRAGRHKMVAPAPVGVGLRQPLVDFAAHVLARVTEAAASAANAASAGGVMQQVKALAEWFDRRVSFVLLASVFALLGEICERPRACCHQRSPAINTGEGSYHR